MRMDAKKRKEKKTNASSFSAKAPQDERRALVSVKAAQPSSWSSVVLLKHGAAPKQKQVKMRPISIAVYFPDFLFPCFFFFFFLAVL